MDELRRAFDETEWAGNVAFVRRLARSLVSDAAGADDVAQETWLAWLRSPPRSAGALQQWLASVVRNVVRMYRRGAARRVAREAGDAELASEPSAADRVAQIDLHRRVVESVLALEEPSRSVIVLRFYEQRSLDDVARALGVPLETVKSRQKRGLAQLRAVLLEDADEKGASRTERWRGLLLLARAGGGGTMTLGAKAGLSAAVGAIVIALGAWGVHELRPRSPTSDQILASSTEPAAVDRAPLPDPAVAVTRAAAEEARSAAASAPEPAGGRCFDVEGDVVDAGGAPLPDVEVELYQVERRRGEGAAIGSATTDERGEFSFPGARFTRNTAGRLIAWNGAACAGADFVLRNGARLHLVLGRTKALHGRVVDTHGDPIAGVELSTVMRFQQVTAGFAVPISRRDRVTVRSADDGSFTLPALPCGWSLTLSASRDGFASRQESLEVADGDDATALTLVLFPESTVAGKVAMPDGAPADGVRVGAQLQREMNRMRNSWGEAITGADGRYVIHGLETGRWNVFVSLDETQEKEWCSLPIEGIELTELAPHGSADFVLGRGGELIVHALDVRTREPIADQWVGIRSAAKSASGAAINAVFTDEEGIGRIRLPPGPVFPYVAQLGESWTGEGGSPIDRSKLELVAGATLELDVSIDRGVSLRGFVVDATGRPVAGALVWQSGFRGGAALQRPQTTSGADGSFVLEHLDSHLRTFQLRASTSTLAMQEPQRIDPASTGMSDIRLQLSERPSGVLRGRVLDADGKPAVGAQVTAIEGGARRREPDPDPDPALQAKCGADGGFELRGLWPDLLYTIEVYRFREQQVGWRDERGAVDTKGPASGVTSELEPVVLKLQAR